MGIDKRIITLIEILGLTSGEFADKINVQRSGISHITSGRNKPSLDFFESTLNTFPEINSEWLILGKGKPLKEQIITNKKEDNSSDLFRDEENLKQPTLLFPTDDLPTKDKKIEETKLGKKDEDLVLEDKKEKIGINEVMRSKKEVDKIIIFYKDNSFDIYEN